MNPQDRQPSQSAPLREEAAWLRLAEAIGPLWATFFRDLFQETGARSPPATVPKPFPSRALTHHHQPPGLLTEKPR